VAAFPGMLEHDRRQAGWSVGQAAWRLGVSPQEYREIEAGTRWPSFETFDRGPSHLVGNLTQAHVGVIVGGLGDEPKWRFAGRRPVSQRVTTPEALLTAD
jgi:hypothetical protein